ncbi:GAP family protein [Streptomyces sp. ISL-10]|uniref:GAP family protein n=1 Tax=Streptomyces sp. ISL-10 TaxID=2819172 RepID=UPI001BEBDF30|nr:GAP family protein [Streptomyces sp. ISL-10]MBT2364791.1 GAP family protein [Streptomyces sp. ISL-10]
MDVLGRILPLALLDTVSVSTLAIPVWFLLTPRDLRIGNVCRYLLLVGAGYLALGLLLLGGLAAVRDPLVDAVRSPAGDAAVAAVGVVLVLIGLWYGFVKRTTADSGRLTRWREAAVGREATARGVVTVALVAVALEIATMFPYLAAVDVLDRSRLPWAEQAALLALYCLVMVAPALLATLARLVAGQAVLPALTWLDSWIRKNARENTAWLFGIVGVLLLSTTTLYERGMHHLSGN